jgi:hypothetical protein
VRDIQLIEYIEEDVLAGILIANSHVILVRKVPVWRNIVEATPAYPRFHLRRTFDEASSSYVPLAIAETYFLRSCCGQSLHYFPLWDLRDAIKHAAVRKMME